MKKTIIITAGGLLFATLFYNQTLGINALIYSTFLIIALVVSKKGLLSKTTTVISALGMLTSAVAICYHGATWSIITYFFSTILFIGYVASSQSSIYISWLNGIYNSVFGVFHSFIYQQEETQVSQSKKKVDVGQLIKLIVIPLFLVIIFTILYSTSNPVFNEVLTAVDFSFINVFWMFTAVFGAFIMANIHQPLPIYDITARDQNYPNELEPKPLNEKQLKSVTNESQIGLISIICLNALLVMVLITEVIFLINSKSNHASVLSSAVHQGVYASIVSILLALTVIAIIFRGNVNFLKKNQNLRRLTYLWIGFNSLLVISIFIKNYTYIDDHGLTHKRIGVMVYLLLTMVGLCTTYLKINYRLNFVYLLRRNLAIGYATIAIYSVINWSAIITDHNIKENHIDPFYLRNLLPQNAMVLKKQGLYDEYTFNKNRKRRRSNKV
ncbi:MAG: DUF4173 domain-containing protein, partial [Nonlabens sp.]